MILWLDAQLPPALAAWIMAQWPHIQAVPVRELGLKDAEDLEIFAQAKTAGPVVMTKDRDFLALLANHGTPPEVIWLRVGNSSNKALQSILLRTLDQAIQRFREGDPWVVVRSSL